MRSRLEGGSTPCRWPARFVVNIGELLELATNGYLRATVHRVVSPPAQRQRLSIAFFLGAQPDAVVPVYALPPELAREARGPDSDPHNPLLRDVGWNYLKGRLRSHPDVAERYYQDVFRERAEQIDRLTITKKEHTMKYAAFKLAGVALSLSLAWTSAQAAALRCRRGTRFPTRRSSTTSKNSIPASI